MERRRAPCVARDRDRRNRRLLRRLRRRSRCDAWARCLAEGFAYQGEPSAFRGGARRGEPSANCRPSAFVVYTAERTTRSATARSASACRCSPMPTRCAQAVASSAAGAVCADAVHGRGVRRVERRFCSSATSDPSWPPPSPRPAQRVRRFARFSDPESRAAIPDPNDLATFRRAAASTGSEAMRAPHARVARFLCKLVAQACGAHHAAARWHRSRRLVAS